MDRVRSGDFGGGDDPLDAKLRLACRRRPDADVVVSKPDVQGFAIGFGIDRDRFDPELLASPHNAQRDLAAICDQNLLEHSGKEMGVRPQLPSRS
jgi:hypothetical protein